MEDEKLGLIYSVTIILDRAFIDRGDAKVNLSPGMSTTADIRTGQRSIMSYLLSPVAQARHEAGREQ
jgi:hemolysin D